MASSQSLPHRSSHAWKGVTVTNELARDVDAPVTYNNRFLAQVEGARTNIYTLSFARWATSQLQITAIAQRLFNHCLTNLPVFRTMDDNLSFGWGEQHLMRLVGVNLAEYEHLLLASALTEFFTVDYAAAVFNAIAASCEDADRPSPLLSSWKGFVTLVNGMLALDEFAIVLDDRIRLNPYHDLNRGIPHARKASDIIPVHNVAQAILGLVQLRRGQIKELTLAGGDVIGWFSAFADLFLGFRIILTDSKGVQLHSANVESSVVLKLIYTPPDMPNDCGSSAIWLREPIHPSIPDTDIPFKLTGRIHNRLLTTIFGPAFHELNVDESKTFANALGGSARVLEIFALNAGLNPEVISAENKANHRSWGIGLIHTWTAWFPELQHLQGRMERSLKLETIDAGKAQCFECINRLELLCGCYICSPTKGPDEKPTNIPRGGFCIPTVMETIIMLGLAFSRVTLVGNLYPSRAGVICMYRSQVRKRLLLKQPHVDGDDSILHDRAYILFGSDWNATYSKRLVNVIALFAGSWPKEDITENMVAISHEGICAYVLKVQRGNISGKHIEDDVIQVTTGTINWRSKTYSRARLGCPVPVVGIEDGWDSTTCSHLDKKLYMK